MPQVKLRAKRPNDIRTIILDDRGLLIFGKNDQPLRLPRKFIKDLEWLLRQPRPGDRPRHRPRIKR